VAVELSYCVVNTSARAHLLRCLEAIERTHPRAIEHEVIVLDNASGDGSGDAVRRRPGIRLISRDRRAGLAENYTILLREARGELCLLLNEDTELEEGAAAALVAALRERPAAAVAGAQLIGPHGDLAACAWRLPSPAVALAQAIGLHRHLVAESGRGPEPREVGWVQSAAMLVRHGAAEAVGYLDPSFFLYSEEVDFQKRLHDAGWKVIQVPAARALHHQRLRNDRSAAPRRIVEFHRGRDAYMRKHHSPPAVLACRALWAWWYVMRAPASLVRRGQGARAYLMHARLALRPRSGGEGMAEAAEAYNRRLASAQALAARAAR
jgi:N-acetylglucosaminyl-diphospho-decaprenol L-rhamnosyltransferase